MGLCSFFIIIPLVTVMAVVLTPNSKWYRIRWISAAGTGILLVLAFVLAVKYWNTAMPEVASMKDALFTKIYFTERMDWFLNDGEEPHCERCGSVDLDVAV